MNTKKPELKVWKNSSRHTDNLNPILFWGEVCIILFFYNTSIISIIITIIDFTHRILNEYNKYYVFVYVFYFYRLHNVYEGGSNQFFSLGK